ncbi:MAG: glycoside hydrolase family 15 protein, partial [Dolichospermum sp.]
EHIECEWPLFFTYLVLDGLFRGEKTQIEKYQQLLKSLLVEQNGVQLLPELYYVPEENIEAEKINPQTQLRLPNENIPLVWAQSLYYLGEMLSEGLISLGDIDPLGRHLSLGKKRNSFFKMLNEMMAGRLQQYIGISGYAQSLLHFGPKVTPQ